MRLRHICLTLLAIASTAMALGGCGGSSTTTTSSGTQAASGTPVHGGSVAVGIDSDPAPLDPIQQTTLGQYFVEYQIYDSLLESDASGGVHPGLVTSWKQQGPLTVVLHLRAGVQFTDGTPFNAAAVVFNINRIRAKTSSWYALTEPIESVSAPNPSTVVIHLRTAYSPLIPLLATRVFEMVSPTAVRKEGANYGRHPVGTGPFELTGWVPNSYVTLKRNPHYWQTGLPYLSSLRFDIEPDSTTRVVSLVTGQLQTIDYIAGEDLNRVQNQPNLVYKTWPGVLVMYLALNPNRPPLNNPNVRQAIQMAIDRSAIANDVEFGLGIPARSMLSPAYWAYSNQIPAIPYDPTKARQLLGGKHYTIQMEVPPTYVQHAQVIKQDLAQVGINVNIENMDWSTLVTNYFKANFAIQIEDQTSTWPDPNDQMAGFYLPNGAYNGTGVAEPAIEQLIAKAQSATSQSQRASYYVQAQELAQKQAIYIPVFYEKNARAWDSNVHGMTERPDSMLDFTHVWISGG
jgi:peptide/nickel transport system substrate-binding protein